jgi:phenylalanine-4-hydroxylase
MAKSLATPSPFALISRLYLWVVEFGLLKRDGVPRIIGAGLISSRSDVLKLVEGGIPLRRFGKAALSQEVEISGDQASLFVIDHLDDVHELLATIG